MEDFTMIASIEMLNVCICIHFCRLVRMEDKVDSNRSQRIDAMVWKKLLITFEDDNVSIDRDDLITLDGGERF